MSTKFIKAQDIHQALRGKVDPALVKYLGELAEQDRTQKEQIAQLASLLDRTLDHYNTLTDAINAIQGDVQLARKHVTAASIIQGKESNVQSEAITPTSEGKGISGYPTK